MDIFQFNPDLLMSFLLTFFRISVVLFLLPFFGGDSTPAPVKAAILLVLTLALFPKLSFPGRLFPGSYWGILLMLLGEAVLGLVIGMLVRFLFDAVQAGGQLIGFQMGFTMVTVVDPMTGISEAATAHFLSMCTMLTFLSLNGHLLLLSGLGQSFDLVPPGGLFLTPALAGHVFEFSKQLFVLAVKIAAPIMAALFLVDLALALISRVAPQMHILTLGFPIKIAVGFFFLGFIFTIMADYVGQYIGELGRAIPVLLRSARP
jgi:flagellar biosynthetic protein FliR